ncbi:MAG: sensor signal transduction histidine kinase [Gammaproteobacteria bacterium]|nr:sensor signal transduction histidine kinase [Gammaproteobacteria bacterium]
MKNQAALQVLLVEDNSGDARLLREMFSKEKTGSFELTHVLRLSEALLLLAKGGIDIVLLDMGLPDGHGLDTVRRARAVAPGVPLIVLTGLDDEALAAQAMKEGAQDYLIKGEIENRALPRALRHSIERHRMQLATDLIHAQVQARTGELKEVNVQLRAEIAARDAAERELRTNNQHLSRSNRDLEDFAYVASHDLKAPLGGIDSAAKWLEEDLHDSLSDESRRILGLMRNRITRMEKLLDDLLTYSRAGRTDTAVGETNVATIFDGILEVLGPPAHITVRVEGELPVIVTASAQLEQVLRNLINNAIKHHDKRTGEVVLSGRHVGNVVEFSVRDDGPGIAPQFHEKIFQLFQTLKRRDEVESSGMGLAVVKKLVEQQNCRITVHSRGDGTGSEFRFGWPTETTGYDLEATENA